MILWSWLRDSKEIANSAWPTRRITCSKAMIHNLVSIWMNLNNVAHITMYEDVVVHENGCGGSETEAKRVCYWRNWEPQQCLEYQPGYVECGQVVHHEFDYFSVLNRAIAPNSVELPSMSLYVVADKTAILACWNSHRQCNATQHDLKMVIVCEVCWIQCTTQRNSSHWPTQ